MDSTVTDSKPFSPLHAKYFFQEKKTRENVQENWNLLNVMWMRTEAETLEMKEICGILFLKHTGPRLHFHNKTELLKGQDLPRAGWRHRLPLGNVCQKHSFYSTDAPLEVKEDFTQNENRVYFWQTGKCPFAKAVITRLSGRWGISNLFLIQIQLLL
jgi:hypothetical protein